MEEQSEPNWTNDQKTVDRIAEAIISAESFVVSSDEITDRLDENLGTTHLNPTKLQDQGRIERMQVCNSKAVWWVPQAVDNVLKSVDPNIILKRLSNELGIPTSLGDGTVYENVDKHSPNELDHKTEPQADTPSTEKNAVGLIPSSEESG